MDVAWLTAFIDLPETRVDDAVGYWRTVTRSDLSPWRDDQTFATFLPETGDPYLRVQRTTDGAPGTHLDLHVPSIAAAGAAAIACGATLVGDMGHRVMASPGGYPFCLVGHDGESDVPQPVADPSPHRVDQLSIDIPAPAFDRECRFWADLTGWELRTGALDEFAYLVRPEGIPLRILLQRLGLDDPAEHARGHLDIACGEGRDAVADAHIALGATFVRRETYWTTLTDPAGLDYCLTRRDPHSGSLG